MFAVQGFNLPKIVAQMPGKRKRKPPSEHTPKPSQPDVKRRKTQTNEPPKKKKVKDVSKYLPYSKDKKGSTGSNQVPVTKERKPRPKSPLPAASAPIAKPTSITSKKKRLARPPRSERDKTPPKLIQETPPPVFSSMAVSALTPLQKKMAAKLSGARFRWINEKLYTTTGSDAFILLSEQPDMFDEYHAGFRAQVTDWPLNPVDIYHDRLSALANSATSVAAAVNSKSDINNNSGSGRVVVADLGCGEAMLARRLVESTASANNKKKITMHSFDLVAANAYITACDVAHLPLPNNSVDIAIFCLSLMGTDFFKFIREAYRVLKQGTGQLWISEIKSRFNTTTATTSDKRSGDGTNSSAKGEDSTANAFIGELKKIGFQVTAVDASNKMFISLDFIKKGKEKRRKEEQEVVEDKDRDSGKIGKLLKPCTYKKR